MRRCPTCQRDVAENAQTCPQCGQFFGSAGNTLAKVAIWVVILVVIVLVFGAIAARG